MESVLVIAIIIIISALVIVASMAPHRSRYSRYELERRVKIGDDHAGLALSREKYAAAVTGLLRLLEILLLGMLMIAAVLRLGSAYGIGLTATATLIYHPLSRWSLLRTVGRALYDRLELRLLTLFRRYAWLARYFGGRDSSPMASSLASRDELFHLLALSKHVISHDDSLAIRGLLTLDDSQVGETMTPRDNIATIDHNDVLGPLVLDKLHKTGHSHFPVVDGGLDNIIGIVAIDNLVTLKTHESAVARDVMDTRTCYVRQDHSLAHALAACLAARQHLLVVINDHQETVGIVSMTSIIDTMLGNKLAIDFSDHESPGAVARYVPSRAQFDIHRHDI